MLELQLYGTPQSGLFLSQPRWRVDARCIEGEWIKEGKSSREGLQGLEMAGKGGEESKTKSNGRKTKGNGNRRTGKRSQRTLRRHP